MYRKVKSSAIHNLRIEEVTNSGEGIIIPEWILEITDIRPFQEIIITKIGAGSWKNRMKTFALMGERNSPVTVCGSVAKFLDAGDLTCIIAESYNDDSQNAMYHSDEIPIMDYGFDPKTNVDNSCGKLDIQYYTKTYRDISADAPEFICAKARRNQLLRSFVDSLILGMVVNKTHCDCLQGSAEIPGSVLSSAHVEQYKSVTVYNSSVGGCADTYAVPMPEGVVMTTGAMASFACVGECVNIASYVLAKDHPIVNITTTDGASVISTKKVCG